MLEVNLPPERVLPPVPKTRPSSSEPAAKRVGASTRSRASAAAVATAMVDCPICNENYPKSAIEEHAASCGDEVYV